MGHRIVIEKLHIPEDHKEMLKQIALKVEGARERRSTKELVRLMDTVSLMWALCENAHEALCGRAW